MAKILSADALCNAAARCNGTLTSFALYAGIDAFTAKKLLHRCPRALAIFREHESMAIDTAEHALKQCLQADSEQVKLAAATFVLKTLGRDKYGEAKVVDESQLKLREVVDLLVDRLKA